ncbi:Acetyltransferase (GNAT) domain-containing protein [Pseudarcicella hirudinis]|uniref:Acetyltransferase (GNAT) domain-containing protein n=1 Tax=Pseudarcicella hirudinis TaxID=1079859 RepID=A0A1I5UEC5_9BACT|nr:GNAT family protein [Pseudarcicella hirudinis]SFP92986.1 Acetyltransferase (GNAT) domain-containing protein [Pseudarcicella hirudinis]
MFQLLFFIFYQMSIQLVTLKETFFSSIVKWKKDEELADLIMAKTSENTESEVAEWVNNNNSDPDQRIWGIYSNDLDKPIGIARLMFINWEAGTTELGLYFGEVDARGKGYGKKVINLLLQKAFDELNLKKVFLKVLSSNIPAMKLYEKMGFEIEGVLKKHHFVKNQLHDVIYMSFFKENYESE